MLKHVSLSVFTLFTLLLAKPSASYSQEADAQKSKTQTDKTDAPAPADSPSEEDLAKARGLFAKGKISFDSGDYDSAITAFKESFKLSKNPLLLYNIGFTLDKSGDTKTALFYYKKFLKDSGPDASNRESAEKRVKALENPGANTSSGEGSALQHKIIDEAPPKFPLDVTAIIPEGVDWKVVLNFRSKGVTEYTEIVMIERSGEMVGRIPAFNMDGSNVQYFLEVKDDNNNVVHRSGEAASPHLILIDKDAKPRFYSDFSEKKRKQSRGPASKWSKYKWGATVGTGVLLAAAGGFDALASRRSNSIASDAVNSQLECSTPPCRIFSGQQESSETRGRTYEAFTNISLGLGIAAGVAATALWVIDWRSQRGEERQAKSKSKQKLYAAPVITPDTVGASALLRF